MKKHKEEEEAKSIILEVEKERKKVRKKEGRFFTFVLCGGSPAAFPVPPLTTITPSPPSPPPLEASIPILERSSSLHIHRQQNLPTYLATCVREIECGLESAE